MKTILLWLTKYHFSWLDVLAIGFIASRELGVATTIFAVVVYSLAAIALERGLRS